MFGWRKASLLSPSPLHYLAGYARDGRVGHHRTGRKIAQPKSADPKLIGWLIIMPIVDLSAVNFQRRLIEGWQIPLCYFRGQLA